MSEFREVLTGSGSYGIVTVVIDSIEIPTDYPRSELGDLDGLAESIRRQGLLAPIVVSPPGESGKFTLKFGLRRLVACRDILGWRTINIFVTNALDEPHQAWVAFRDENTARKGLAPSEALIVAERIQQLLAPVAAQRIKATQFKADDEGGARQPQGEKRPISAAVANLPQPVDMPKGKKVRDVAAAAVGHSASSLRTVKKVVQAAHDESLPDEVREQVQEQLQVMDETGNVNRAWQAVKSLIAEPKAVDEKEVAHRKLKSATASLSKALAFTQEALDLGDLAAGDFDAELAEIERAAQQALELVHQVRRARFKVVG